MSSPSKRSSSSSSPATPTISISPSKSFHSFSRSRSSSRPTSKTEEALEEWVGDSGTSLTPDGIIIGEDDEFGSVPGAEEYDQQHQQLGAGTGGKKKGKFTLKRSKSGLKLFSSSSSSSSSSPASTSPPTTFSSGTSPLPIPHSGGSTDASLYPTHAPYSPSKPSTTTRLDRHLSTNSTSSTTSGSFFLPPPPPTPTSGNNNNINTQRRPSTSSLSPSIPPTPTTATASTRIGGWFSTLIHPNNSNASSSSSNLPLPPPPTSLPGSFPSTQPTSPPSNRIFKIPLASSTFTSTPNSTTSSTSAVGGKLKPLNQFLDKAAAYLFDADAHHAASAAAGGEIWVMGVRHDPTPVSAGVVVGESSTTTNTGTGGNGGGGGGRKLLGGKKRRKKASAGGVTIVPPGASAVNGGVEVLEDRNSPYPWSSSAAGGGIRRDSSPSSSASISSFSSSTEDYSPTIDEPPSPIIEETYGWPQSFYRDFYSRIYLSYRTNFIGIPCSPPTPTPSVLSQSPSNNNHIGSSNGGGGGVMGMFNNLNLNMSIGRGGAGWGKGSQAVREGGWTTDTGWGCMLRTGQSLLANALGMWVLGRDWRISLPGSLSSPDSKSATYHRLLTLFHDSPSSSHQTPFSIHSFAHQGELRGTPVGSWFGPSVAAGAIGGLVNALSSSSSSEEGKEGGIEVGIRVVVAEGATIYQSDVEREGGWGEEGEANKRGVLVLMGLRLGIDGVNPVYYDAVKAIFRFPQSVGIAGGRPSSSYYFVGTQADSLFYLDPHHPCPALSPPSLPASLLQTSLETPLGEEEGELRDWFEGLASTNVGPGEGWRSYHCGRVRKMGMSSLDPSMLVGFLIRDKEDWEDFRSRVDEVAAHHKPIFAIANSPPSWMLPKPSRPRTTTAETTESITDSSEGGVESFSEGDEDWEEGREDVTGEVVDLGEVEGRGQEEEDQWLEGNTTAKGEVFEREEQEEEGEGVLVEESDAGKVEFERKEEGWEGVGLAVTSPKEEGGDRTLESHEDKDIVKKVEE